MARKGIFKNKNIIRIFMFLSLSLVIVIIAIVGFLNYTSNIKKILNQRMIYNNIYVNGINIGNMSKEDAKSNLDRTIKLDENITLFYMDKEYTYKKYDFGVEYDIQNAVDSAYSIGRIGAVNERYKIIKSLNNIPKSIKLLKNIDEQLVKDKLEDIFIYINVEPQNASLEKTEDGFNVIEGKNGIQVNSEKTYDRVLFGLNSDGDSFVEIIVDSIEPEYNSKDLDKIKDKIGSYSTKYNNIRGDEGRVTNMKVAASNINGTILYPGEIFSTNKKFGETTKNNGYKLAPTILNGKLIDSYGGGVCQISSTLYNAVLYAELEIVERQNHSLKVGYLDYGYDATLAGNYIDFKFRNSTDYPIYVESYLTDNQVICNIYGYERRPINREIKFENVLIEVIEPSPKVIRYSNELSLGQEKVEVTSLKGYKYKVYKLIYEDGNLIDKIFINNSYYKPRPEEVVVGTRPISKRIAKSENNKLIIKENIKEELLIEEDLLEQKSEETLEDVLGILENIREE